MLRHKPNGFGPCMQTKIQMKCASWSANHIEYTCVMRENVHRWTLSDASENVQSVKGYCRVVCGAKMKFILALKLWQRLYLQSEFKFVSQGGEFCINRSTRLNLSVQHFKRPMVCYTTSTWLHNAWCELFSFSRSVGFYVLWLEIKWTKVLDGQICTEYHVLV